MRTRLIGGVIILLGVVVNQSAIHWRSNDADSSLFAYYGWCVSNGARPYLDIWDNKPPGIWWANAATIRLCGPGIGSDLVLGSLALVATLIAFVGAARALFGRHLTLPAAVVGAVLLTDARFECGANRTETFVVACETVAVCAYLRWLQGRRRGWLITAGLLAGMAPLFKQSGLAAAAAILLHHLYATARASWSPAHPRSDDELRVRTSGLVLTCRLAATLAVAPAVTATVLAVQGALSEAVFAVGRFNRAYFATGEAAWLNLTPALQTAGPVLEPLAGVAALVGLGLVWAFWQAVTTRRHRTPAGDEETGAQRSWAAPWTAGLPVLLLWLAGAAYLALAGPGRRGHHFMPLLPPLGLLTLYPLYLLTGGRKLVPELVARPGVAGLLIVGGYVLAMVGVGNSAELWRCWQTKPAWYALDRTTPTEEQQRAAEVQRRTTPSDMIYVWGWSPGTYRWACRRAASRFATIEKFGQVGVNARFVVDGAVADILRNEPRVIFLSTSDHAGIVEHDPGEFGLWLLENYEKGPNVGGMYLLERRKAQSEPRP